MDAMYIRRKDNNTIFFILSLYSLYQFNRELKTTPALACAVTRGSSSSSAFFAGALFLFLATLFIFVVFQLIAFHLYFSPSVPPAKLAYIYSHRDKGISDYNN